MRVLLGIRRRRRLGRRAAAAAAAGSFPVVRVLLGIRRRRRLGRQPGRRRCANAVRHVEGAANALGTLRKPVGVSSRVIVHGADATTGVETEAPCSSVEAVIDEGVVAAQGISVVARFRVAVSSENLEVRGHHRIDLARDVDPHDSQGTRRSPKGRSRDVGESAGSRGGDAPDVTDGGEQPRECSQLPRRRCRAGALRAVTQQRRALVQRPAVRRGSIAHHIGCRDTITSKTTPSCASRVVSRGGTRSLERWLQPGSYLPSYLV